MFWVIDSTAVQIHISRLYVYIMTLTNVDRASLLKLVIKRWKTPEKTSGVWEVPVLSPSAPTFFFNFLMDFYQNETIVRKQRIQLESMLKGEKVVRDAYLRFVIVSES